MASGWSEQCPLRGTCSECGLKYSWGDLHDPARQDVPQFIEHAPRGVRGLFVAAWRTLWWVLSFSIWTKVRIEHRVVLSRAALGVFIVILTTHVFASLLAMTRVIWTMRGFWGPGAPPGSLSVEGFMWQLCSAWVYPVAGVWWGRGLSGLEWHIEYWPMPVLLAVVTHVAAVALLLMLPTTRRLANVRAAHVFRAGIYGLSWIVLLGAFRVARNALVVAQILATDARAEVVTGPFGATSVRMGGPTPVFIDSVPRLLLQCVLMGWVGLWWYVTLRRGWKIRRAWLVWVVLAIPAVLASQVFESAMWFF